MFVEELRLNEKKKQQLSIGTPLFPCMCYDQYMDQLIDGEVPWHWQEELEFFVVCQGKAQMECQEMQVEIEEGEGVFIGSGALHRASAMDGKRCKYYSILFQPELIYGMPQGIVDQRYVRPVLECRELSFVKFDRKTEWMQKVLYYVGRAREAFHNGTFGYELLVRENFSRAWYYFVVNTRSMVEKRNQELDEREQRLKDMVKYIYDHYEESVNVAQIAQAAGISESECFRCFRKNLGTSPVEFLLNHRIRTAAGLLRDTGKSVTEISYGVGFNNPSYFTKCFREILNCTPREYRKREKAEERKEMRHDL
ncbi:MAG TPA: AraC family transcriptional regulator [Candidatus Blautia gallistercoris]|uniref:AraC family transcriptional regulator n=1 Tax=Candidatus Blautia gallistercoris TaxID=2838490 RepID=A0A9D1WGF1_9FIRM|nr:AraC family transcriptional regulator [Candidatus Blautia gallistercoris]